MDALVSFMRGKESMQIVGKVLWWDDRDGNGIIKDCDGHKYYFDTSVVDSRYLSKIKSGLTVRFELNQAIKDSLCAHKVAPASVREQNRLQRELESRRQLELFA